ncbi:MAG: hypothetical protein ABIG61_11480 [Planctomycetota bacterium]
MKKIGLVIGVLTVLVLLSGVALAECVRDCLLTYDTCLNLCRQSGKGDDSACTDHCQKGRDGCIKRCEANNDRSENTTNKKNLEVSEIINCVCAECNKKCGTGHETWCSSYQKPKAKDTMSQYSYMHASPAEGKSQELIVEPVSTKIDNKKIRPTTIILASGNNLACNVGGKVVHNCPQDSPYYNVFSHDCYATLKDCKKSQWRYRWSRRVCPLQQLNAKIRTADVFGGFLHL